MAAVLERSRRATAGKRLATLVGEAADEDDTFWSHAIWSEGRGGFSSGKTGERNGEDEDGGEASDGESSDGSLTDGEGSYRASDEDPEAAVDLFDSDFNESESDSEEEMDVEGELLREEKREKRAVHDAKVPKHGRRGGPGRGNRGAIKAKRVLGEGWNTGLVLNWFANGEGGRSSSALATSSSVAAGGFVNSASVATQPASVSSHVPTSMPTSTMKPASTQSMAVSSHTLTTQPAPNQSVSIANSIPIAPSNSTKPINNSRTQDQQRKRNLRAVTLSKTIDTVQQSEENEKLTAKRSQMAKATLNKGKRAYTQEEMILESIQSTEVMNNKWIFGRKRRKEATDEDTTKTSIESGNVVERFYSRRGGCNVMSFMDMERLPDILTRPANGGKRKHAIESVAKVCAVTGKEARYRDPRTMLGYYDLKAFKELRRRADAGLLNKSKARSRFPKDRTMMACTSDLSSIKVMVSQFGAPVSPPEMKLEVESNGSNIAQFPTKRAPEEVTSNGVIEADSAVVKPTIVGSKTPVSTKSNIFITSPGNNGSNTTNTMIPSRKSPRKPKPSAKVLADATSSNHLLRTQPATVSATGIFDNAPALPNLKKNIAPVTSTKTEQTINPPRSTTPKLAPETVIRVNKKIKMVHEPDSKTIDKINGPDSTNGTGDIIIL